MSFMYAVYPVSEGHYVLPITAGMKVPVHAYLSPSLFAKTSEVLWRQAANAASYPSVEKVSLMPDGHEGFHVPVGSVVVTKGTMALAGSGFDISCGVLHAKVDGLHVSALVDKTARRKWIGAVEARIATGLGSHRPERAGKIDAKRVIWEASLLRAFS
jgi:RNA-splicing ligase RtcB